MFSKHRNENLLVLGILNHILSSEGGWQGRYQQLASHVKVMSHLGY